MTEQFAPFGLQRDMLLHAMRDRDDQPVVHRYGNVWEAVLIEGEVDVATLFAVAQAAADDLDSLQARLLRADGVDRLVRDPDRPVLATSALDLATGDVEDGPDAGDPAAIETAGGVELLRSVVAHPPRPATGPARPRGRAAADPDLACAGDRARPRGI